MTAPKDDRSGIRQTIRALRAAGYVLDSVDDGDDDLITVTTETAALDAITAVDDARLYVTHPDRVGRRSMVRFVMGNMPDEVVCDYSVSLSDVLDPLIDRWLA